MKKLLLFTFLLVQTLTVFGYDYQTVYSHRLLYFDNEFGRTEAIKMDSVRLQQNDSVIYPFRGLQLIAENCLTPKGNTWMGEKIIITSGYNYFFNELNDTIIIKTIAILNETWEVYTKNDVRITGTVTKWELSEVLGQQDSVKTITLHVYDARMSPLPHPLEGKIIKISKKYGIVASVSLLYFPASQYSNFSSIRIPQEFTLSGMTNPILGVQNFTWFEANDFQIGDEFHYQELEFSLSDHRKSGRSIKKIVERTNYLPDSIIYTYNIRSVDTVTTYNPIYETKIIYNNKIKHEKISSYKIFDLLPGQIEYIDSNHIAKSIMFGFEKSLYPEEMAGSDNCWNNGVEIDGSCEQSYAKGLGLFYKSCSTVFWFSNYEKKLVYYKKGNEEWGTPIHIPNPNVSFAPKGTEWYYNEELYPIWYELPHEYNYSLLRSVGDTIINNKTCNHIKLIQNHVGYELLENAYCYQQNDTVYFYSQWNSQFYPVYVWNAKKGDTWNINYSIDSGSNYRVIATLDSMKYINISGRMLRQQFITYKSEYYGIMRNVQVIEGIGDVDNLYSFDFSEFLTCDDFGGNINGLRCYVHPEYGTYKTSDKECDFRTGLEKLKQLTFSISPNPAKDILKITLNQSIYEPTTAKIVNSLGKTVFVQKLESQEQTVSLKNIPTGIYLLQIEKGNQNESVKFIKQ